MVGRQQAHSYGHLTALFFILMADSLSVTLETTVCELSTALE
jgi:hypothetical protein